MGLTVIDKSWPIESIGSRLRDHARTFDFGVRARSNYRRTLPGKDYQTLETTLHDYTFFDPSDSIYADAFEFLYTLIRWPRMQLPQ